MGGADKHMMHPYDNLSIRFSDILSIIVSTGNGTMAVTEKLDGLNLNWSYSKSTPRFARNMGDVKSGGTDLEGFDQWLGSHPGRDQFMTGAHAINDMKPSWMLPTDVWVSTEVISSKRPQLLKYDRDYLVFHGLSKPESQHKFMESVTTEFEDSYRSLVENSDSEWTLKGQIPIALSDRSDEAFYNYALQELTEIMRVWDMQWWNTLEDLIEAKTRKRIDWWGLTEEEIKSFVDMTLGRGGSVVKFRKLLPVSYHEDLNSIGMHKSREKWRKTCLEDIKAVLVRYSAALLAPMNSALINDKASQQSRLRALIYYSVNEVKKVKDKSPKHIAAWENLSTYLETYQSLNVEPPTIEGLVFYHKGHRYKLTGAFASLNRVIGTARYDLGIKMPKI